jgi:hypothetical protein
MNTLALKGRRHNWNCTEQYHFCVKEWNMGDEMNPLDKHSHSRNTIYVRRETLDTG